MNYDSILKEHNSFTINLLSVEFLLNEGIEWLFAL